MKVTLENDQYIVIDDFLDKEVFDKLHLQLDSLAYVPLVYGHDKVYKASCGDIYKNDKKYWYDKPEKSPKYIQLFMDAVHSAGKNEAKNVINSDFTNFGMLVHAYRAGAELSWHIDAMQFKEHTRIMYIKNGVIHGEETSYLLIRIQRLMYLQTQDQILKQKVYMIGVEEQYIGLIQSTKEGKY